MKGRGNKKGEEKMGGENCRRENKRNEGGEQNKKKRKNSDKRDEN